MQLGFLMDHRRCIGCHACTVACKSENDVPLGSFRTWVKYTEKGVFPAVKRHFTVLRCNHCSRTPCVTICPVSALAKRHDGIVDLDRDACIGCRACMQACPFDALHLDPASGAVAKCHFCAHRIEQKLAPACVVVCPEQAIVFGDLHDPRSRIARMVEEHATLVRRPEQRTEPNVHYLDTLPEALQPGLAERPATYIWSERPKSKPEPWPASVATAPDVRTVLDVGHEVQWGWQVAAYLVTKGLAAGAALLAPFAQQLGLKGASLRWGPELVGIVFTLLTALLLVEDLARPLKFLTLLTRSNRRSWLVKGAWILLAFGATVGATLACTYLSGRSALPAGFERVPWEHLIAPLRWISAVLALGVAGYTAFLFGQCEGRDLWQSKLLLPHLLVQALACGAALFLFLQWLVPGPHGTELRAIALIALLAHVMLVLIERVRPHATVNARQASAFLGVVRWHALPAFRLSCFVAAASLAALGFAPGLALAPVLFGLYVYEYAYVRAAQLPPLA